MKTYHAVLLVLLAVAQPALALIDNRELTRAWRDYQNHSAGAEPNAEFPYQRCFERAGAAHDLPVTLLLAVARAESDFDPRARSHKNALGLMQIRWPITAKDLGIYRKRDLYQPCTNVEAGARYLRRLLDRYHGDLHLALAAYNYGPGRISAQKVPDGARWYSSYVYRHLRYVLGKSDNASKAPGARQHKQRYLDERKQVVMTFHQAYLARNLLEYLEEASPDSRFEWFRAPLGRHQVVILYRGPKEHTRALATVRGLGIPVERR
ncbi:lytic transglycosylase domain-containing protein [Exilibacterium tricleocarpae]|uniref:Lytic transglycosylase domain-containing protein n=1 Tax=Exilibacterium tricleocarpae TaxID=2591008 RepID=A0A545SNF4_9GAMM|nr:lytic transglycosylase domain-containing protein [Exilibacterium tricleocarpae]TQV66491.1 lytic transglycosylase domain-containing protein [Exilibacterium tricleocarpae]